MKKIFILMSTVVLILTGCSNGYVTKDTAKEKKDGQSTYEVNNVVFNSSLVFANGEHYGQDYIIRIEYKTYDEYNQEQDKDVKNFDEFAKELEADVLQIEQEFVENGDETSTIVAEYEKIRGTYAIKITLTDNETYISQMYYLPVENGSILVQSHSNSEPGIPKKEIKEILDSIYTV